MPPSPGGMPPAKPQASNELPRPSNSFQVFQYCRASDSKSPGNCPNGALATDPPVRADSSSARMAPPVSGLGDAQGLADHQRPGYREQQHQRMQPPRSQPPVAAPQVLADPARR